MAPALHTWACKERICMLRSTYFPFFFESVRLIHEENGLTVTRCLRTALFALCRFQNQHSVSTKVFYRLRVSSTFEEHSTITRSIRCFALSLRSTHWVSIFKKEISNIQYINNLSIFHSRDGFRDDELHT